LDRSGLEPEMPEVSENKKPAANWTRLSGLGIELAAAVGGAVALGYWWDHHFGSSPWGIVGWGAVGLVGGMYNLIRQSLLAFKEEGSDAKAKAGSGNKPEDGGPQR
jgi:F0F1-type ATP synthase assembly protein I